LQAMIASRSATGRSVSSLKAFCTRSIN
jgi:hypothetical protein